MEFYLIKSRILDESEPPSAFYTDQEIRFNDPDFAACIDYNRLLNNTENSFLNCSHELGPSPTVAEVETNGSTGTTPFT